MLFAFDTSVCFVLPIVAPLAAALAAFLLDGRWTRRLPCAVSLLVAAATVGVTVDVHRSGPQRYPLGSWNAPLGIDLYADGLTCMMLLMTSIVGIAVSGYAMSYFTEPAAGPSTAAAQHRPPQSAFWPLWMFLWSALNALFLSADVFNLYVTLELLTLAAIGLVALAGTRLALEAALRYLLAALAGSLLYLAAVALVYGEYGALDVASLGELAAATPTTKVALVLMVVGLMLKTALFPFHFWLPPAHGSAPAPVSALLSGLVVKGSFYLLLRLWFALFPGEVTVLPGAALALCGTAAILWGSLQAILAERLKMLVAYSTVAQLGYLFLPFALAKVDSADGFAPWSAGILYAFSHACAKAALFLAAGTILAAAGHDRIAELSAVSRRLPITYFAMGIAAVSLMGLPPTASFVAKWMLLERSIAAGHGWLAVVILVGSLLAAVYLFRFLALAFQPPGDVVPSVDFQPTPRAQQYVTLALAVAGLLLGLFASPAVALLEIGSPWSELAAQGVAR